MVNQFLSSLPNPLQLADGHEGDLSHRGHVLEPGVQGLADGVDDEADLPQLLRVHDIAAVKHEGGLLHVVEDLLVVQGLELVPLSQDAQTVGALGGLIRVPDAAHLLHGGGARRLQVHRVVPVELVHCQVPLDLVLSHLGVVDADLGLVTQKTLAHVDGRGLSGVTSVLLEGKAKDGDLLASHGVEHGRHHAVDETALLVVVDLDHLLPVVGNLGQAVALTDVHQVQDILLEAGATETNTGVQELGANPGVLAHGISHFRYIGTSGLAEGGDGVHRGDPLRQERIGSELGELSRPQVGGEDPVLRNPVGIHILKSLNGLPALRGLPATDEHSVRLEQVLNGCSLSKELRVGEDLVVDALAVVGQDLLNGLCGLDRDSGFLNNDLVRLGDISNHTSSTLPVGEVGSLSSTKTTGLGGCVHRDEDNVSLSDVLLNIGAEEEVLAPALLHNIIETRLIDRESVAVPGLDAGLGDVDNDNLNIRALEGNDCHCRATDVASTDAADLHHLVS
ncbi:hypothetical protein PR202_gb10892 [Eleusine coracana subsp. coracana]|uniref:Uncharacterized protein n=1 Tax=Eleusine coracana subsp. coracana TaxID=191504 RepID=A0AAV5ELM5_ELECO|nr:hypothetical protein PR202_gb10892 [Eleusine coracana subsp. coracana]